MKNLFKTLATVLFAASAVSCVVDEGYCDYTNERIMSFSGTICDFITDYVAQEFADPKKVSEDSTLVLTELDVDDYDYYGIDIDCITFTAQFRLLPESTERFPSWELEFDGEYNEGAGRSATFRSTTPIQIYWDENDYGSWVTTCIYKKGKARVEIFISGKMQDWCNVTFRGDSYKTYTTSRD